LAAGKTYFGLAAERQQSGKFRDMKAQLSAYYRVICGKLSGKGRV